jgi:two-component system response regulator YesN
MYNLLVVEDEEMIRNKILNNVDWHEVGFSQVFSAENGLDALDIINRNQIDLLIADIQMPVMNGIELIKELKKQGRQIKVIIISGHAEFEYAWESIRLNVSSYLLKPFQTVNLVQVVTETLAELTLEQNRQAEIESLRQQLQQNLTNLQIKFLTDLLNNNFSGNIADNLHYLQLAWMKERDYLVGVFKIDHFPAISNIAAGEVEYLGNLTIFQWINHFLSGQQLSFYLINYSLNKIVAVFFNEQALVLPVLERLIGQIEPKLNCQLTIGVGDSFQDLRDLPISFKQAMAAVRLSCIHGKSILYTYNDLSLDSKAYNKLLYLIGEDRLYHHLQVGDFEEIQLVLAEILQEIKKSRLQMEAIGILINNMMLLSNKTINELGIHPEEIFGEDFTPFFDIEIINDISQLEASLYKYFETISVYIRCKHQKQNEQMISQIIGDLNKNYCENISLTNIAKKLNVSCGYLSLQFKRYTNQNFIDFLTNLRMQKAKELLKNSKLKVYEIGEKVGYSDAFYFSAAFKRAIGVSPSDYRENIELFKVTTPRAPLRCYPTDTPP